MTGELEGGLGPVWGWSPPGVGVLEESLQKDHADLFDILTDGLQNATIMSARSAELPRISPAAWT